MEEAAKENIGNVVIKEPEEEIPASENEAVGDHEETDANETSFYKGKKKKQLKAVMPVWKYADFYKMDHKNRGIAVILNQEHFMAHTNQDDRVGTNVDAKRLEKTLQNLKFDVQIHKDLTANEIRLHIEKLSKMDHSDNDCFLLVCLTHGNEANVYARDSLYNPETLWTPFTADKCPSLAGKPKLFFIQACRGRKMDPGVKLVKPHTQTDSSPSYRIPTQADFLLAYSTVPGFASRSQEQGSCFIQALCEQIAEHSSVLHMLNILTFVNRKVAVDFELHDPEDLDFHGKPIPCITYMLTRLLMFPKNTQPQEE